MKIPLATALLPLLALLLVACGKLEPRTTLRTGMLSIDGDNRELMKILGVPAQSARAKVLIDRMRAFADDPNFAQRTKSVAFKGNAESFEQHRAFYIETVDALKQAIETGTGQPLKLYARMNMSCQVCHNEFRPGI